MCETSRALAITFSIVHIIWMAASMMFGAIAIPIELSYGLVLPYLIFLAVTITGLVGDAQKKATTVLVFQIFAVMGICGRVGLIVYCFTDIMDVVDNTNYISKYPAYDKSTLETYVFVSAGCLVFDIILLSVLMWAQCGARKEIKLEAPVPGSATNSGHGPAQNYGYGQTPNYGYGQAPAYGYSPAPNYGYAPSPNNGYGQAPAYGYAPSPNYGYSPAPNYGYGQAPAYGYGPAPAAPQATVPASVPKAAESATVPKAAETAAVPKAVEPTTVPQVPDQAKEPKPAEPTSEPKAAEPATVPQA